MRRPLLPAFTTLGAVQGWLLLDAANGVFDCSGQPLSTCARDWLTTVAVFALGATAAATFLSCARTPTIGRFVACFIGATFLTVWVPVLFAGGRTRWNMDLALNLFGIPFFIALFALPFFALPFFAWRAARARPGSLVGRAETRGIWIAVSAAVVTATSLTSRARGWMFDDMVGRFGPPHIGARVELWLELLALVAMAPLVARDVGDAVRVARIDLALLAPGPSHAAETLDLGVGEGAHVERLEAGASYRESAAAFAITGDVERAWRVLFRRVWLDAIAVAIGVGALCAFQPITH